VQCIVGQNWGSRSLGRPRRGRDDNIKMGLQYIGWKGMNWNYLSQG
jgi:hypothetical protein